ncbi:MAG: DNRLRE domain-containing protein [Thermoproteota archaeon]
MGRAGIALCFLMTMVVLYSTAPQVTIGVVPDGVSQLVRKFYPSGDSVVYEGDPDRNFGSNWEIGVNYRNGSRDRSFIIFDLSEMPPGSIISSATLNLYMYDAPNLSRMLACYEIIEKWDEFKITWNMQPTAPVFVTSISTGNKSKLLSLDVKGSVIKFTSKDVIDYEPNYG